MLSIHKDRQSGLGLDYLPPYNEDRSIVNE
jgi:hypothetical protein